MILSSLITDVGAWLDKHADKVLAAISAAVLSFFGFWLNRLGARLNARQSQADAQRRRDEDGDASVRVEHIRGFRDLQAGLERENDLLRKDAEKAEQKHEEAVALLTWKFARLSIAYNELHRITMANSPALQLTHLDPFTLFTSLEQPLAVTVVSTSESKDKKTTAAFKTIQIPDKR